MRSWYGAVSGSFQGGKVTMPLAKSARTITILGQAALLAYVVAALCFGAGLLWDQDELREAGLGVAIFGVALDMRHYTARGITRLIQHISLWQDAGTEPDPQHRREEPPPAEAAGA